ncbi:Ras-related protein Rab-11A [Enteropsectra breve]|nr:Ras-related protein Rab-11A [Enteropsectra breve]
MEGLKESKTYLFKIVLIGDSYTGKTNILSRLINDRPLKDSKPTIGVEFGTKLVKINDDSVNVQLWDTAGQERYHAITSAYYRGSHGAVIVYDITSKDSFDNSLSLWLSTVKDAAKTDIPIILLGNKNDLESDRAVSYSDAQARAHSMGIGFFETSALTGTNVQQAFDSFIKTLYNKETEKEVSFGKAKVRREDLVGKQLEMKNKEKKSRCC